MILNIILLILFVFVIICFLLFFTVVWAFESAEEFDECNRWFH